MTEEDQLPKEQSEAQLHDELEDMRNLVHSAGWNTLVETLNESIFQRKTAVIFESIVKDNGDYMQNLLKNEYEKGFLQGLAHAVAMPNARIDDITNQLKLDKPEEDDDV